MGESYYENARAKAEFGRAVGEPGVWMLGEDSGIEVAALGGRPGIASARWAEDGVAGLLEALEGVSDRRARYVCELVALAPDGEERRGTGILEGAIATERRGEEGFGYDPIFVPGGRGAHRCRVGQRLEAAELPPRPRRRRSDAK